MSVPLWLGVLLSILALWGLLVTFCRPVRRFLLFVIDEGGPIFACPTLEALVVAARLVRIYGHQAKLRIKDNLVDRALFDSGMIFNTSDPDFLARLRNAVAGYAIVRKDPHGDALKAATFLRFQGYQYVLLPSLGREEAPPVFIQFVCGLLRIPTSGPRLVFLLPAEGSEKKLFNGSVLVFRRHFLLMGLKPPQWDQALMEMEVFGRTLD